jgi:hypothetical protein
VEIDRRPKLQVVLEERDDGSYSSWMPCCIDTGEI